MFIRTLAIMGQESVSHISVPDESSSASYNTHEMTSFLRSVAVAKGITGINIEAWIEQVRCKLHKVGAISVRGTVASLTLLNCKLRGANLHMMHSQTISLMAREGVESLLRESQELSGFVDTGPPNEAEDGLCSTCKTPGGIGQACNICNDGTSTYLNFPAGY
jgi:hypothetical protein